MEAFLHGAGSSVGTIGKVFGHPSSVLIKETVERMAINGNGRISVALAEAQRRVISGYEYDSKNIKLVSRDIKDGTPAPVQSGDRIPSSPTTQKVPAAFWAWYVVIDPH
jgi:hypothetical protein